MRFRCPGQTAARQADAQTLALITEPSQWWQRGSPRGVGGGGWERLLFPLQVVSLPTGMQQVPVFHPRNPGQGGYFKEIWGKGRKS